MRNINYALKSICKLNWVNLAKIFSLSIGIAISVIIVCRHSFYQSFEDFLPQTENTHVLTMNWIINDKDIGEQMHTLAPMAPELVAKIKSIDKATRISRNYIEWGNGKNSFFLNGVSTDSMFFDVFPRKIIEGDQSAIMKGGPFVMISEDAAKKLYPNGNAVGKGILLRNKHDLEIKGVYESFPKNSHLHSLDIIFAGNFPPRWGGGDSFFTYFTTIHKVDYNELNREINEAFSAHMTEDSKYICKAHNIKAALGFMSEDGESTNTVYLAIAIFVLLVTTLNFALTHINSLISRAKEVGVLKSVGVSNKQIFGIVIWETIIYIFISTLVATLIIYSLRGVIENLAGDYNNIFTIDNLYLVIILFIITTILSGLAPAYIFAKIPASSIYRNFKDSNIWWKQLLLFIQITCSITACTVSIGFSLQHNFMTKFDMGYDYSNLVTQKVSDIDSVTKITLKNELLKLPQIKSVSYSEMLPIHGMSGIFVHDKTGEKSLFSSRFFGIDKDFFKTYGIEIINGNISNFSNNNVFVSEQLIKATNSTNDSLNFLIHGMNTIGVMKDIRSNLFNSADPMIFYKLKSNTTNASISILTNKNINKEQFTQIENKITEITKSSNHSLISYDNIVNDMYISIKQTANSIIWSSLALLLITIIGMISYIATEIKQKQRMIAISRIIGANYTNIIFSVCKRLLIISSFAATTATLGSLYIMNLTLSHFIEKVSLSWWIFTLGIALIVTLIIIITLLLTYKVYNNYTKIIGKV